MKRIPVYGLMLVRDSSVAAESKKADSPAAVSEILKKYLQGKDRENFVVMLLSVRQDIIGINTVSVGTLTASLVHSREIFKPAILAGAASIIICHNHASGDPTPSAEDREVTARIKRAGETLGIPLTDHVIVTDDKSYSFREMGGLE